MEESPHPHDDGPSTKTFSAPSLEEAIQLALAHFDCPRDRLHVSKVLTPTWFQRKILGRPFQIAAHPLPTQSDSEPEREGTPGTLQIKEGRVSYVAPTGAGRFPTISPVQGLHIFVDGQLLNEPTVILPGQQVTLTPTLAEPRQTYSLELSDDKMEAFLLLHRVPGRQYVLADHPPATELTPRVSLQETALPSLSAEDIRSLLDKEGVVYGIDEQALATCLTLMGEHRIRIAAGVQPTPPVHDELELLFDTSSEPAPGPQRTVQRGEVVALLRRGEAGKPGYTVTGEIVEPPPKHELQDVAGPGTILYEDRIVAATPGRPESCGERVRIQAVHIINGDTNPTAGPIRFPGDVIVKGSVTEGTLIEAEGQVRVGGSIFGAEVKAGGNVSADQSIVRSTVTAGGKSAQRARIRLILASLLDMLNRLMAEVEGQYSEDEADGPSPQARLRAAMTGDWYRRYQTVYRDKLQPLLSGQNDDVASAIERLDDDIHDIRKGDLGDIHALKQSMRSIHLLLEQMKEEENSPAFIFTSYLQNSRLEASGDIRVAGSGAYQSFLTAGHAITIEGQHSLLRGGEAFAHQHIRVDELGSPAGAPTYVSVGAKGRIRARVAHPQTRIEVGTEQRHLLRRERHLDAHLDRDGKLKL